VTAREPDPKPVAEDLVDAAVVMACVTAGMAPGNRLVGLAASTAADTVAGSVVGGCQTRIVATTVIVGIVEVVVVENRSGIADVVVAGNLPEVAAKLGFAVAAADSAKTGSQRMFVPAVLGRVVDSGLEMPETSAPGRTSDTCSRRHSSAASNPRREAFCLFYVSLLSS